MSSISSTFKSKVLQLYSSEQYFCYIQVSSITYSYIQASSIIAIFKSAVLLLYSSQQYYSYIQASSITAIFKSAVLQLYSSQQYYSYIQVSSNSANPIFKTAVLVIFKSAVLQLLLPNADVLQQYEDLCQIILSLYLRREQAYKQYIIQEYRWH